MRLKRLLETLLIETNILLFSTNSYDQNYLLAYGTKDDIARSFDFEELMDVMNSYVYSIEPVKTKLTKEITKDRHNPALIIKISDKYDKLDSEDNRFDMNWDNEESVNDFINSISWIYSIDID